MAKVNPPSVRYPFEADISKLPEGIRRAHRYAFNSIVDLQQSIGSLKTQISALQTKGGVSTTVPTKSLAFDAPLETNPDIGIIPIQTAGRIGVAPTGGSSANSSATAATNSSYGKNAYIAGVNPQTSATAYILQDTDYAGTVVFNSASAVAISLNSAVVTNFSCNVMNIGKGGIIVSPLMVRVAAGGALYTLGDVLTITQGGASGGTVLVSAVNAGAVTQVQVVTGGTGYVAANGLATTGGTGAGCTLNIIQVGMVNNVTSVAFQGGAFTIVAFDGMKWWAMAFQGVLPQTFTPVAGEFITGYSALTGIFSAAYVNSINPYKAVTTTYGILTTDYQIEATSGTFTATLPTAIGITGQSFSIKNSGAGVVTLAVGSSRVDLQACKLEYSIVSPK